MQHLILVNTSFTTSLAVFHIVIEDHRYQWRVLCFMFEEAFQTAPYNTRCQPIFCSAKSTVLLLSPEILSSVLWWLGSQAQVLLAFFFCFPGLKTAKSRLCLFINWYAYWKVKKMKHIFTGRYDWVQEFNLSCQLQWPFCCFSTDVFSVVLKWFHGMPKTCFHSISGETWSWNIIKDIVNLQYWLI